MPLTSLGDLVEPATAADRIWSPLQQISRGSSDLPGNVDSADALGIAADDVQLYRMFRAFQQALDQQAIVTVTDPEGRIRFANTKFEQISGYEKKELVGQTHRIVNSGHHPTDFFEEMWTSISSGLIWRGEICNRSRSGTLYWVDTTIVPILDQQGRTEAYVSIRYDISWRKDFEKALQEEVDLRRQAEDLLRHVIETIPDGVAAFDPEDRLVIYNDAYADYLGLSRDLLKIGPATNPFCVRVWNWDAFFYRVLLYREEEVGCSRS